MQGYKDKNPEKFGSIDILPGIQTSVSRNVTNGRMELPVEKPNKGTVYIVLTMDPTNQHVDRREIQPKPEDRKISFDMSLNTNSMYVNSETVGSLIRTVKNNKTFLMYE